MGHEYERPSAAAAPQIKINYLAAGAPFVTGTPYTATLPTLRPRPRLRTGRSDSGPCGRTALTVPE